MAATKYQILYRYINNHSNQYLINDTPDEYKNVREFYTDKHKIEVGLPEERVAAIEEQSNLIVDGNNTASSNYNMLFKFAGTKRINKQEWKPKSTGYVIRDPQPIKDLITDAVNKGDFTGQYLLMEGTTIENGVVVAKNNIPSTITVFTDNSLAQNGKWYQTEEEVMNLVTNSTIYKLTDVSATDYLRNPKNRKKSISGYHYRNSSNSMVYLSTWDVYEGPIFFTEAPDSRTGTVDGNPTTSDSCVLNENNSFEKCTIEPTQIETYEIPAHYEPSVEYPYLVCDTYERVEQSPWFILSTHSSLESALEKAKEVALKVGLDNVKLVKTVPTDQFIKIN